MQESDALKRIELAQAMQMVVVYLYLYPLICLDCLLVSDSDPFFSIDLHRLNTRAIAERFGKSKFAPAGPFIVPKPSETKHHAAEFQIVMQVWNICFLTLRLI